MEALDMQGDAGKRKNYLGSVDLVKFIMVMLIMTHHLYLLGYADDYPGISCWVWVDYFFMLTGFFTMHHFSSGKREAKYGDEAIRYTIHKFKKFVPYILIAVIMQYLMMAFPYIRQHDLKGFLATFADMPYELLLLSSSGIVEAKVAPIWFLSAMFLTLPLLIYMLLKFEDLWCILAWLIPVLYYGKMGINTLRTWPNDLVRAFSCMALGTFVFLITQKLKGMRFTALQRILLTVAELGTFGLCVYIAVTDIPYMQKPYKVLLPLLFVVHATIMLSGCSYTAKIKGSACAFLGEISLPMFLFQWGIGTVAVKLTSGDGIRLGIYYLGTILAAVVIVGLKHKFFCNRGKEV